MQMFYFSIAALADCNSAQAGRAKSLKILPIMQTDKGLLFKTHSQSVDHYLFTKALRPQVL